MAGVFPGVIAPHPNPGGVAPPPVAPPTLAPYGNQMLPLAPYGNQMVPFAPQGNQMVPLPPPGQVIPRPVDQGFGPIGPAGTQAAGGQMTTDAQLAHSASQHLSNALAAVQDPELRQSLATAMATLHKYVAGIHKEHQQALAGKVSPRLLQHAYGTVPGGSALMYGPAAGSVL